MTSEPIIIVYNTSTCVHCHNLSNIWDKVSDALKGVYPTIRFCTVTAEKMDGKFDEGVAPRDLIRYNKWYPMILLIPTSGAICLGNLSADNKLFMLVCMLIIENLALRYL